MSCADGYRCLHCNGETLSDPPYWAVCSRCRDRVYARLAGDSDRDAAIERLSAAVSGGYISFESHEKRLETILGPDINVNVVEHAVAGCPEVVRRSAAPWDGTISDGCSIIWNGLKKSEATWPVISFILLAVLMVVAIAL